MTIITAILFVLYIAFAYVGLFGFFAAVGQIVRHRRIDVVLDVIVFGSLAIFGVVGIFEVVT